MSFTLRAGEVHALVGENGAGKSTLIKILAGVHAPDDGRVVVAGRERRFRSPREALAAGVVLIPQELRLVPALSVAENVMLGHLPRRRVLGVLPVVDGRGMRRGGRAALERLGFATDLDACVNTLTYAEQQLVAIAKALSHRAHVLILDEPTAALGQREVHRLFGTLAALKAQGVAIIYVSHRLEEVIELADRCTVLRDGRVVDTIERGRFDLGYLVRAMTGRDVERRHGPAGRRAGRALLTAEQNVSVHAHEVIGLAGLLGSGTAHLVRRIFGAGRPPAEVRIQDTTAVVTRPPFAIRAGIGMVPGERAKGVVFNLSVRDNILLPSLGAFGGSAGDRVVAELIELLDIRPPHPDCLARTLSGGNQQKVIFARWLAAKVVVLLLEDPTQGIDVSAKAQIHRLIREFADKGGGVLFTSADANEILAESDRVLAMRQGRIVARLERGDGYSERDLRTVLGG